MPIATAGRPRRYCSAACRQAAYRSRELAAAAIDRTAMAALAIRLRDNADQLWLLSQGWAPPEGRDGVSLDTLLTDTIAIAEEMAVRRHGPSYGTRDNFPPHSLD
jgi:hypothetical protein